MFTEFWLLRLNATPCAEAALCPQILPQMALPPSCLFNGSLVLTVDRVSDIHPPPLSRSHDFLQQICTFEAAAPQLFFDGRLVLAVAGDVLDAVCVLLKGIVCVVRDLEGHRGLAPSQQGHVMSLLQQLPCQVDADEARPSCK